MRSICCRGRPITEKSWNIEFSKELDAISRTRCFASCPYFFRSKHELFFVILVSPSPPLLFFSFSFFSPPFCDNRIHSKSKVAVCSFGKSTMIRHCLSSRDISSRVYSPLTCCVSVTLAPHSSIQTLSRVYNSNSDGPRLPSFRIHDPLIRFIHSRVKNTGLLKCRQFELFYSPICYPPPLFFLSL